MAAEILSGKSLLLPREGCYRSSSFGLAYPPVRSKKMLFCCRSKSGGRDMHKWVAKTLHRRPRNMKGLKLSNQEVLKELEDKEVENESTQASYLNMGDNSLADQEEVVSKIVIPSDDDGVAIESRILKIKLEQIGFKQS